jgi:hypothetical protein
MRLRAALLALALAASAPAWPPPAGSLAQSPAAPGERPPAAEPAPAERRAILEAVRARVAGGRTLPRRLRVRHLSARGGWAYLRAGEEVRVESRWQETDGDIAALLRRARRAPLARPAWAVVELWTRAGEQRRPFSAFARRVRARERSERVPAGVIPADLLAP